MSLGGKKARAELKPREIANWCLPDESNAIINSITGGGRARNEQTEESRMQLLLITSRYREI